MGARTGCCRGKHQLVEAGRAMAGLCRFEFKECRLAQAHPDPARLAGTQVEDIMSWRVKHDERFQLFHDISLSMLPHMDSLHFLQGSCHDTPQRTFCFHHFSSTEFH